MTLRGEIWLTPPNLRLQRTPSASPPSPLSRKPLGASWPCGGDL